MIHGGGWRAGDKASWAPEAGRLAERGWLAFSVNYRLDEPNPFPAEVDDVEAAVRWVRAHASEYGVDPARIAAVGESAGGLLAACSPPGTRPARRGRPGPGGCGLVATGRPDRAGPGGDGWAGRLMGCTLATCPDRLADASPVTHVDPTDAPLYLVNSSQELVPLSQAEAMAGKLRAAGVDHRLDVYPGTRHALDFRQDAWAPTVAFLEKHLVERPPGGSAGPGRLGLAGGVALVLVATGLLVRRRVSRNRPKRNDSAHSSGG